MKIHFYSKTNDFELEYFADAKKIDGAYIFKDESLENTQISMKPIGNTLLFERFGDVSMKVLYENGKNCSGAYANKMGLDFDFVAKTDLLDIKDNEINLQYDLFIDGEKQNTCRIRILIQ